MKQSVTNITINGVRFKETLGELEVFYETEKLEYLYKSKNASLTLIPHDTDAERLGGIYRLSTDYTKLFANNLYVKVKMQVQHKPWITLEGEFIIYSKTNPGNVIHLASKDVIVQTIDETKLPKVNLELTYDEAINLKSFIGSTPQQSIMTDIYIKVSKGLENYE